MLHACALSLRSLGGPLRRADTHRSSTDASTDGRRRTGRMRTGRVHAVPPFCPRVVLFFFFFFLTNHQSARVSAACWKMAGKLEPREVKSQEVVEDGEGSEGKGPLASRVEGREPSSPCPSAVRSHSIVAEFAAPWTVAHQTPSFRGFPGKNTGVGCLL